MRVNCMFNNVVRYNLVSERKKYMTLQLDIDGVKIYSYNDFNDEVKTKINDIALGNDIKRYGDIYFSGKPDDLYRFLFDLTLHYYINVI